MPWAEGACAAAATPAKLPKLHSLLQMEALRAGLDGTPLVLIQVSGCMGKALQGAAKSVAQWVVYMFA